MLAMLSFLFTIYLVIEAKEEIPNENRMALGDCSPSYLKYKPEKNKYYLLMCHAGDSFDDQSKQCLQHQMIEECQYGVSDRIINYQLTGEAADFCERNQIYSGFAVDGCSKDFVLCKNMQTLAVECPGDLFWDEETNQCQEAMNTPACGGMNVMKERPKGQTPSKIFYFIIPSIFSTLFLALIPSIWAALHSHSYEKEKSD